MVSANHTWSPGPSDSQAVPSKYAYKVGGGGGGSSGFGATPVDLQFLSPYEPYTSHHYTETWKPDWSVPAADAGMFDMSKEQAKALAQAQAQAQGVQASVFGYQLPGLAGMEAPGGTWAGLPVGGGGVMTGGWRRDRGRRRRRRRSKVMLRRMKDVVHPVDGPVRTSGG